jgi:excisionase family DNA binding protein
MSAPLNWWTVEVASKNSGYHDNYIRKLARQGKITAQHLGRTWLIEPDSLRAYVREMEADGDPRTGPQGKRK